MTKQRFFGVYRLFFAGALAAVGVQFALGLRRETFNVLNFFTTESNLIAAFAFLVMGNSVMRAAERNRFTVLRGLPPYP